MKLILSIILVLVAFFTCISGEMKILTPESLKNWWQNNKDLTQTSIATFGYTPWGRKIAGNLALSQPLDACSPINGLSKEFLKNIILVAMRGDCTFVAKAHYAQIAGAKMLLVVDNQDEDIAYHLMVDNTGQGENIHIPVILTTKKAGDKLIEAVDGAEKIKSTVSMSYDFEMNKGDKIKYNLWLTSSSMQSYTFVREWERFEKLLNSSAVMDIHYSHFESPEQLEHCICKGRYCATDPDGDRPNTGRDVIFEDLKQLVLLRHYGRETWLKYVSLYDTFCISAGKMWECADALLKEIGLNEAEVRAKVDSTFDIQDFDHCNTNSYLEPEKEQMIKDGVYLFPSVNINGLTYRGNLFPVGNVVEAVCESLNTMPSVCSEFITTEQGPPVRPNSINIWTLLFYLIVVTVVVLVVLTLYQRKMRRDLDGKIRYEVNLMMEQYTSLKDSSDK